MREIDQKFTGRIHALEYMVASLHNVVFAMKGISADRADEMNDALLQKLAKRTIGGVDPTASDMLSADFEAGSVK